MGWGYLVIFSRTTGPILTRFGIILGGRGLKFLQMKGIALFEGEVIVKE
jgi:hypothetical protein